MVKDAFTAEAEGSDDDKPAPKSVTSTVLRYVSVILLSAYCTPLMFWQGTSVVVHHGHSRRGGKKCLRDGMQLLHLVS